MIGVMNIGSGGTKAYIDGVLYKKDLNLINIIENLGALPYYFQSGAAVVLNNEIHLLGGYDSYVNDGNNRTTHYKYDGSTWASLGALPYEFYYGAAVVLNDEIHLLGGKDNNTTKHYKYDGSTWTSVNTLPYDFSSGSAVVLNDEIHLFGGYIDRTAHWAANFTMYKEV